MKANQALQKSLQQDICINIYWETSPSFAHYDEYEILRQ